MTTSSTIELTNRTAGEMTNQSIWTESARLLYAGRIEEFLTYWSADASYEAAYPVPGMPAVITGHEALRAVFGGFGAAAEKIEVRDVTFHQTADPDVAIVEERMFATLRDGGTYENRMVIRVTFRDGLITSMFEYYGELAHRDLLQRLGFTS